MSAVRRKGTRLAGWTAGAGLILAAGLTGGRLLWQSHRAPQVLAELRSAEGPNEVVVVAADGTCFGFMSTDIGSGSGRTITLREGAFVVVGATGTFSRWLRQGDTRQTILNALRLRRQGLRATSASVIATSGTAKEAVTLKVSRVLHPW